MNIQQERPRPKDHKSNNSLQPQIYILNLSQALQDGNAGIAGANPKTIRKTRLHSNTDHAKPGPSPSQNTKTNKIENPESELDCEADKILPQPDRDYYYVPLNSLPSSEAALRIQTVSVCIFFLNIRQRILSYSKPRDLLQFRFVSRDWRQDATNKRLLEWNRNKIIIDTKPADKKFYARHLDWEEKLRKPIPIQKLNEVMNRTGSNTFPCSRFNISLENMERDVDGLDHFLKNHGSRMKSVSLDLHYKYYSATPFTSDTQSMLYHGVKWVIEIVSKLLFEQAPNLEFLQISFDAASYFSDGLPCKLTCKPFPTPISNTNKDSLEIPVATAKHLKLQTIVLWKGAEKSIFEYFCQLAPNLKSIKGCNLNHFLEPINRLYLLDELMYHPYYYSDPEIEDNVVKKIGNMEGKLELEALHIYPEEIYENSKCWTEVAEICNKLLEKSSLSVKNLCLFLTPLGFLPGLRIPKMPNVKWILFDGNYPAIEDTHFFPPGMLISNVFPNLDTIGIGDGFSTFSHFLSNPEFILGCKENIVPSVKLIIIEGNARSHLSSELYQQCFPNAIIKIS